MPRAVIQFHRLAAEEFRKARSWYARRSQRAAVRFVEAVDQGLELIADNPERWPLYDQRHHSIKMRKFPYILIYRVVPDGGVIIVAVAHASRRPGYWRRRRT